MRKIGILGGTFNPIHNGHLILAQNALEQYSLDEVLFIPSGCSYKKQGVLDAQTRYHMVELAIASNPLFHISPIEIVRPGNSYTCETLAELKAQMQDAVQYEYIIGADTLFSIESWKNPKAIFAHCNILCNVRDGFSMSQLKEKQSYLDKKYGANIHFLREKSFDISSSEIRERLKEGKCVSYYMPENVLAYIMQKELYTKGM